MRRFHLASGIEDRLLRRTRFAAAALARNLPIAFANHAHGPHAFDLFDEGAMTRAMVRQTLAFLGAHLLP